MKKFISILLTAILLLGVCAPAALAAEIYEPQWRGNVPFIRICGDGQELVDADGGRILNYKGLLSGSDDEDGDSAILEAVVNVITPFLLDGLITDNWDPYYDALYDEISDLFENSLLNPDGTAEEGSGILQERKNDMEKAMTYDLADRNGNYGAWTYEFYYDWRLDPWENADALNLYIEGVKEATGRDRVAVQGSCVGTGVLFSYIRKYGTEDLCYVGVDIATVGGAELLSDPISGNFNLDGDAINRFIADCAAVELFDLDSFLDQTIDLIAATGAVDMLGEGVRETIYEKLVYGVTSSLALSTFYTFPSYWAAVEAEDFEAAKEHVFGPEGSEKRIEYAGLIEKIDNFDVEVRQNIPEILARVENDKDCALAIFAKYGVQLAPIAQNTDDIGDQIASLTNASFGATTSKIYDTLSEEYIAQRVAEGKGKYVSPDKQVDASTCLYPDYTYFIKGASHSRYTYAEEAIGIATAMAMANEDKQLTVDNFELSQFIVFSYDDGNCYRMTEENCDTYYWDAEEPIDDDDDAGYGFRVITKLILWLIGLIEILVAKFGA